MVEDKDIKAKAVTEHKAIQNVKQSKKAEAKDINLNTKFQRHTKCG